MADGEGSIRAHRAIAFVGNYLPRACGIATFTCDLAEATAKAPTNPYPVVVAAVNDTARGYDYPDRVGFQIQADCIADYRRAAEFLNDTSRIVCLQHEFGIFGGRAGAHILRLVQQLRVPLVVTCHTVLTTPDNDQRNVFFDLLGRADRAVVMNPRASGYMEMLYGVPRDRLVCIPHGVHEVSFADPPRYKTSFGVEGPVLLTFGLLHREKGLHYMVDAMVEVVRRVPNVTYVIAGATHPVVKRTEGESYRQELKKRIDCLGLRERVKFIDRFMDLSDLLRVLSDTDIFVAPYLNLERMTSGALSYAAAAGTAVVSTPFLHARELLADGRGVLVPTRDPKTLARRVVALLENRVELKAMRRRIYTHTRGMVWPKIAEEYVTLFEEVCLHGAEGSSRLPEAARRAGTPSVSGRRLGPAD